MLRARQNECHHQEGKQPGNTVAAGRELHNEHVQTALQQSGTQLRQRGQQHSHHILRIRLRLPAAAVDSDLIFTVLETKLATVFCYILHVSITS